MKASETYTYTISEEEKVAIIDHLGEIKHYLFHLDQDRNSVDDPTEEDLDTLYVKFIHICSLFWNIGILDGFGKSTGDSTIITINSKF